MNYEKISKAIKENMNLKTNPVAIKLFEKESEAEKHLPKSNKIIHCQAIITSSKGESFYGTQNEIGCPIATQILGLKKVKENFLNGKYFDKNNVTKTQNSGKTLIENTPILNKKIEAIGYTSLEKTTFKPDVIAIVAKPKQIYNIIRAHVYENGERIESSVSGTQSFCGDITIKSYLTNTVNISYGCVGSHLATDFKETEIVCGIPINKLETITNALEIVKLPQ